MHLSYTLHREDRRSTQHCSRGLRTTPARSGVEQASVTKQPGVAREHVGSIYRNRPQPLEPSRRERVATASGWSFLPEKADDFFNRPYGFRYAGFHRRGYGQLLMRPPEVVMHEVECHGCGVV